MKPSASSMHPRSGSFNIRNARESDLIHVMHINRTCLPENYSYGFFLRLLRDYPAAFLVGEIEGRVVGYVMCRVERNMSRIEKLRVRKTGHIISVAVLPEHRRQGLALGMVVRVLEALKKSYGCTESYLEVRASNEEATKLYQKLGYLIVSRERSYYIDGEDAYIMARSLK